MTLTSAKDIVTYIDKFPEKLSLDAGHTYTVKELTGGTANWVFRVTDNADGSTSVLKHAEAYVRHMPSIAFASNRMNYEAAVLKILQHVYPGQEAASEKSFMVVPARCLAYDQDAKLLRMSDGGEQTLKAAYISGAGIDLPEAGASLGAWLAGLHTTTLGLDIGDNQAAKTIYRHSYNNLGRALQEYGFERALGERVNHEFGIKLQTDTGQICHSDFWTGNVLVRMGPLQLTVVDWEMVRDGNGATDVGQFAAEAWLLDRFHGEKGLLGAFLRAYRAAQGSGWDESFEQRQRIIVQFATHIAYWPTRVEWGNRVETTEIVRMGRDMLVHALDRDWHWFKPSPLGSIM